jgi:hypothetical protein
MSADPFANTTTVKNILQHVISPKIVKDGNGGYVSKTDLVNVHNLVFTGYNPSVELGTQAKPFTSQYGTSTYTGGPIPNIENGKYLTVYHSRVTPNSVIIAIVSNEVSPRFLYAITPGSGSFTIVISADTATAGIKVTWFIAAF